MSFSSRSGSILRLVGQSTVEPISLAEMKIHLRMESTDSTSEDSLIRSYITASRKEAENITKRAIVSSTWQLIVDDFSHSTVAIELPRPPLSTEAANVSITYVKDTTAGDTTTIGTTVYTVDPDREPGRVYPTYNNEWPDDVRDQRKAVTIQYISGYSADTTSTPCPEGLKTWIKLRTAVYYENRESVVEGIVVSNLRRNLVDGLLDQYTLYTVTS